MSAEELQEVSHCSSTVPLQKADGCQSKQAPGTLRQGELIPFSDFVMNEC